MLVRHLGGRQKRLEATNPQLKFTKKGAAGRNLPGRSCPPQYDSSKTHRSQKISRTPIPLPEVSGACGVRYAIMRVWESFCHIPRHALYTKQPTRSQATRPIPYLWKRSGRLRRPHPTWKRHEHGSTERMSILKASMC